MNQEYDVRDCMTLSQGSSARMVRSHELDPEVRRRKDMESEDTDGRYIQMFCDRYRDRGIAGRVYADAAKQRKKEALTRAVAPGTHVDTAALSGREQLNKYRSGREDGKRFMTAADFGQYYHDQRGYRHPQYRVSGDRHSPMEVMEEAAEAGEVLPPKKAGWLTDTDKCPALVRKLLKYPVFVRLNEWAGETFPRETEMVRATDRKALRIPVGAVAALVVVAVSMSLVISSTVLVSRSTREVSQLKDTLAARQEVLGDLSDQLDLKNDLLDIRDKAVNQLGMVGEKYVSGSRLDTSSEDYLEVFGEGEDRGHMETSGRENPEDDGKTGWAAILSAFGLDRD